MRIWDPGWKKSDPGSGMKKIRNRDKHPGSAPLLVVSTSGLVLGKLGVQGGVVALVLVLVGLHHPQQFTMQTQALTLTVYCQLLCFFFYRIQFSNFDAAPESHTLTCR
jgi:hypothetical protein